MKILIIEDDACTANSLELMLKADGFNVTVTEFGEDGVDQAKVYDYDLLIIGQGLSDLPATDVVRKIRMALITTPIIYLASFDSVAMQVSSLSIGCDDYMAKPVNSEVLGARAKALVRRSKGVADNIITIGDLTVNIDQKRATVLGRALHLTGKEYQLVELLALRNGTTLTKEAVMNHLYGGMDEPELKIIDVFVCKIRRKLKYAGAGGLIQTVWGRGYVMQAPAVEQAAA